ncbi:chloroplast J-like domain protein 1 [Tanacetum coccineum]
MLIVAIFHKLPHAVVQDQFTIKIAVIAFGLFPWQSDPKQAQICKLMTDWWSYIKPTLEPTSMNHILSHLFPKSEVKDTRIDMAIYTTFIGWIVVACSDDWKPVQFLSFAFIYRIFEKLKPFEPRESSIFVEEGEDEGRMMRMGKRLLCFLPFAFRCKDFAPLRTDQSYVVSVKDQLIQQCHRNKHIVIDLGTSNNKKIDWPIKEKHGIIAIVETVYHGSWGDDGSWFGTFT